MVIICQNCQMNILGFFGTQTPQTQSTYNCQKDTLSKIELIKDISTKETWEFPCSCQAAVQKEHGTVLYTSRQS